MNRRLLAVLLALVAVLSVLSACGKDDDGPRTAAQLRADLLTQADVPQGLTLQPAEPEEEEEATGQGSSCLEQDVDDVVPPAASATAEFASADGTRTVTHELRSYKEGDAARSMDEGRSQLEKCRTFEETDEEGTFKGTITDLDFPDLGDETVAVTIEATVANVTVSGDFVVVRDGEVVTSVGNLVVAGQADHAATESLVRKTLEKLG